MGEWTGTGIGFGNTSSTISSNYARVMGGQYIELLHESHFKPTESKPEGEHHIDRGFISYDQSRKVYVYRQFNVEGFVNQYVLNEELSTEKQLVFETEVIENFVAGGKARWTIILHGPGEIETVFDLSFPGKDYACFGTNKLSRK